LLPALIAVQTAQANPTPTNPSVAFYYGSHLPAAELSQFDQVVVQADQADAEDVAFLRRRGATVFAYISLSELSHTQASAIDSHLVLGSNPDWDTVILDAAQPQWRQRLLTGYFQPLWERGYHAFFLDNLDSYERAVSSRDGRLAQVHGLAQIIKDVHERFPGVVLLCNRGFELLPEVAPLIAGMVAESLFRSWETGQKVYGEVSAQEREELLAELRNARDRYHLPITVIDYVPPGQRELARATARRIAALGMTPWVTERALATLGVGVVELVPRRILALYNGTEQLDVLKNPDVAYAPIHRMAAVVLEHLGYAVDYLDVRDPLPSGPLQDKYAGIVTWFEDTRVPSPGIYRAWLLNQIAEGMKVAILGHIGIGPDHQLQQRLGLSFEDRGAKGAVRVLLADPATTGFEVKVEARQNEFFPQQIHEQQDSARRLLSVEDESGTRMDAVFTASWGGMACYPYFIAQGYDESYRWVINPFAFIKQALKLPDLPAPDVTTLDGHRMLIVTIDGDGFPSRAEMPSNQYSGKVILEQILKHYPVKATVSIIEGEIGPTGRWPQLSPELETIARDIFALPNVEVASHSYSHPFDWLRFGHDQEDGSMNGLFRYDYSLRREIQGSVDYINRRLAPRDKPTKVFLWSGDAVAPAEALLQAQSTGILNMNGGDTIITNRRPTLTLVSAMGRPIGGYYQTYAPEQNENVYTNEWKGPFYGFRDVISTYQLTERPRRLKPIDIYFHFYSGSKIGSLKVLKQVFVWALSQDVIPVYASEYIRKVEDFQGLTLARRLDGCWQLRGDGQLTTLRVESDSKSGTVDRVRSRGVTSVREIPQGRYIGLDGSGRAVLCLRPRPTSTTVANRLTAASAAKLSAQNAASVR
jgi:hypothetical protein